MMFEKSAAETAELRFHILNSMMDDAENVEQVYLSVNKNNFLKEPFQFQPKYLLQEIIDEMKSMLEECFIRAHFSNDEHQAPLENVNLCLFHHYWFSPTETGKGIWKKRREAEEK